MREVVDMQVPEVDIAQALERLQAGGTVFVDVRDRGSFEAGRIPGAVHLDDMTVMDYVASADKEAPVVIYCYHGFSSQGGAAFFLDSGFREVYSMSGGFTAWEAAGQPSEAGSPA